MNMNIKTKLTYGIGLLFVLITLLGGLAIKNIHNVSDDTQNILADNYNSLLYSRQMLESLDAIRENPNARKEFEAGLEAQKKNLTEKDEDVLTNRLSSNCEKALDDMDDESIRQIRQTIYTIMAVNMSAIYEKNEVAVHTAERSLFLDLDGRNCLYRDRLPLSGSPATLGQRTDPEIDGWHQGNHQCQLQQTAQFGQ